LVVVALSAGVSCHAARGTLLIGSRTLGRGRHRGRRLAQDALQVAALHAQRAGRAGHVAAVDDVCAVDGLALHGEEIDGWSNWRRWRRVVRECELDPVDVDLAGHQIRPGCVCVADEFGEHPEAAHDDDANGWMPGTQRSDEVTAAVALAQEVVNEGDIERLCVGEGSRLCCRVGCRYLKARAREHRLAQLSERIVVVHHQHVRPSSAPAMNCKIQRSAEDSA
jgi:hypothetical protein